MRIAVIGGGAAGLFASTVVTKLGHECLLYERESRVGKKLLATGNGRCNLTNLALSPERYHGETEFAEFALREFNQYSLMEFLRDIGIICINEEDKVFPYCLQASAVLDMLRLSASGERTEDEVTAIMPEKKGFMVVSLKGREKVDKVIVCCGGKASRKLSGGGSYHLLTNLKHKITPLKPAIVQLKCDGTKALEGIKTNAVVTLDERKEAGEVLFTSYGLSGPPVLQLSRDAKGKLLKIDLAPDLDFKDVVQVMSERRKISELTLENFFTGFLNKKIGREVLKRANVLPFSRSAGTITDKEIKSLASLIKAFSFEIQDTNGFDNAQVTAGGIQCLDFNSKTMESKIVPGLYAAGEMLNIDGDCGGFNLQWAFSSAYIAAHHACGCSEGEI